MKKLFSIILTMVLAFAAVMAFASCAEGKTPVITSNWKFETISVDGKTTKAADLKEEERPMITIDEDRLTKGEYFVTYRQSGKNHKATMTEVDGKYVIDFVDSEKDMTAKVRGDKLTLQIDGRSGASIVFRYTDEEVFIPVDEKTAPDYMKAKMTDKGKVEITNESDSEYMYGMFYQLEYKHNGTWCYARAIESFAWTAQGIILFGGSSKTEEYDLSHYGTLKPGEYRLAVGEMNACIYAYFTVNADGTFSYPG